MCPQQMDEGAGDVQVHAPADGLLCPAGTDAEEGAGQAVAEPKPKMLRRL